MKRNSPLSDTAVFFSGTGMLLYSKVTSVELFSCEGSCGGEEGGGEGIGKSASSSFSCCQPLVICDVVRASG